MKTFTIDLHLNFPMKDGETKEDAEDRLFDGLDEIVPGYVVWYSGIVVEEYED